MKRIAYLTTLLLLNACPVLAEDIPERYENIKIESVFSKMIERDQKDRVYSGQIRTEAGLKEFEKAYGIDIAKHVDFKKKMLVFGITDNITSRAFQFLRQAKMGEFTLDYADTGIMLKMADPENGKKFSYVQVFIIDRTNGIGHIAVKNLVENGLSILYDK